MNCYICVFNIIYVYLINGHTYGHVYYSEVLIILCPSSSAAYYADFMKGKNTMGKKKKKEKEKNNQIGQIKLAVTGAIISLLTI